jgi:hypothetical protein
MRHMLFSLLLFLIVPLSRAQDGYVVSLQTSMNRMDLYSGIRFGTEFGRWEGGVSVETGINRTFIQSRFYPRVTAGLNLNIVNKDKFRVGPALSYSYSMLRVNKNTGSIHHWNEVYGGYVLSCGKTWRFCHSAMTGLMNERFISQVTTKRTGVNTLGFYISFGMAYAW